MEKIIFQIHRIKLQDYVQSALIAPDCYLGDEIEKDIQSNNPNFLVVSDGYLEELDQSQILLELILTEEEKLRMYKVGEVMYFDFPLPITRIKKIHCHDKEVMQHIIVNLATSEKGFLNENIFFADLHSKKPLFQKRELRAITEDIEAKDYKEKIIYFDKRMGMFSFMKNTNLYLSDKTMGISNYSNHYFSSLSKFLQTPLENGKFKDIATALENKEFKELLFSDVQIDQEFIKKISINIEDEEIKELFSNLLSPNKTKTTLATLWEKKELTYYLITLVYYFRLKDANKKDNFKANITAFIPLEVLEVSLAILGLYFGYKNLRAYETIELDGKYFQKLLDKDRKVNIKFKMDSKLDYITIESIYNYTFHNKAKSDSFDYLSYEEKESRNLKWFKEKDFKLYYDLVEEKTIFDEVVLTIRKKSHQEIIIERLKNYPDIIEMKHYLLIFIKKYMPDAILYKDEKSKEPYCEKSLFENEVGNLPETIDINEFFGVNLLDSKNV